MATIKTLQAPGAVGGDAVQIVPNRGKGVKRSIIIHVQNAVNVTAFFAHERTQLLQPDNLGNIGGIPVGKNGAATPFIFIDWEGPMYGVSGLGALGPATCVIEEGFA